MEWKQVGLAGRRPFNNFVKLKYTVESAFDEFGIIRYRAVNISNGAIVPLEGNQGKKIKPYIYNNGDTWFPMRGLPYIFNTELPGWFLIKFT